ncbi:MAG: hypothetical protein JO322_13020 [Candidatus Eremiobacteraeota bacterium]|nr:hypothetical protein [Candidatus Eremiobacteraeota bacterium]
MASIKQVEDTIFNKEGFRVKLTALDGKKSVALPPYDYEYMASNKWKLTDWRMVRMARYIPFLKSMDIFRGDGTKTTTDLRLGNLRDTYFAEFCEDDMRSLEEGRISRD